MSTKRLKFFKPRQKTQHRSEQLKLKHSKMISLFTIILLSLLLLLNIKMIESQECRFVLFARFNV
jgi:hypothetical protein